MAEMEHGRSAWSLPFKVGDVMASDLDFTEESIIAFTRLTGDDNPLHHDVEAARRSRFGGLIASGTQTTALMLGALGHHVAARGASLGLECSFRLRKAVPVGPALVQWTVTAVEPKPSLKGHIITLDGVLRHGDDIYVTSTMKIVALPGDALN